ncbi:MAG: substrate-binding domain-containing protein [Candidatus Rifleibacteriota bacterium]
MKNKWLSFCLVAFFFSGLQILLPTKIAAASIKIATTTSLQDSGLLDSLLAEFNKFSKIQIKIIARGTGAALKEGRDGNVDAVLAHARDLEEEFVAQGFAAKRYPVMHNDFVLVGPQDDPAQVGKSKDIAVALKSLAFSDKEVLFISRGDKSGTHVLEQKLWNKAQVTMPAKQYLSVGQGMGKTLLIAAEKQAYTLVDRPTFLNYCNDQTQLKILFAGDSALYNEYAFLPVSPARHPYVAHKETNEFLNWLLSEAGQKAISSFRINNQQVFFLEEL